MSAFQMGRWWDPGLRKIEFVSRVARRLSHFDNVAISWCNQRTESFDIPCPSSIHPRKTKLIKDRLIARQSTSYATFQAQSYWLLHDNYLSVRNDLIILFHSEELGQKCCKWQSATIASILSDAVLDRIVLKQRGYGSFPTMNSDWVWTLIITVC